MAGVARTAQRTPAGAVDYSHSRKGPLPQGLTDNKNDIHSSQFLSLASFQALKLMNSLELRHFVRCYYYPRCTQRGMRHREVKELAQSHTGGK